MDSSSIELPESTISHVILDNTTLKIYFSRAYIIKTMTGSAERTRWWQSGILAFDNANITSPPLLQGSFICRGGDITDNLYTYRDMLPIPWQARGHVRCLLHLAPAACVNSKMWGTHPHPPNEGVVVSPTDSLPQSLQVEAKAGYLQLIDVAKYIEHIRPSN